jgi:hypothetical protein
MAGLEFRLISTKVGLSLKLPKPLDSAVKPEDDIASVFEQIASRAGGEKISRLLLVCHAYQSGGEFTVFVGSVGGKLGFRLGDVGIFGPLADKFESKLRGIEIQGCNVAENRGLSPQAVPTVGSGAALCQAIADTAYTGVLASTDPQPTSCQKEEGTITQRNNRGMVETQEYSRVVDCEDVWSGNLWSFRPGRKGAKKGR